MLMKSSASDALVGRTIADKFKSEAITAALPLNAPGLSLWARQPYAQLVRHEADYPLSYRFDETDSAVLFENVKVPWESVFCHDYAEMSRAIYMLTPGHAMANHQANVRFLAKLSLIVGIASKLAEMNNAPSHPGSAVHPRSACCDAGDSGGIDHGPDQLRRATSGRLSHRQSSLRLCGAALVQQSLRGNLRLGPGAYGRRRVPDAC